MTASSREWTFQTDDAGSHRLLLTGKVLRRLGDVLLAAGALGALGSVVTLAATAIWSSSHVGLAADALIWSGTALLLASVVRQLGRSTTHAGQTRDVAVGLDRGGVSWSGALTGKTPWDALQHVIVTQNPSGARRLIFTREPGDAGGLATASSAAHFIRRLWSPDRFVLDLPLDRLGTPPETVVQAIQQASGGRFPDSQPTPAAHRKHHS